MKSIIFTVTLENKSKQNSKKSVKISIKFIYEKCREIYNKSQIVIMLDFSITLLCI